MGGGQSLQKTVKFTGAQKIYDSPLISYLIYDGPDWPS
jgi:hypothetical protein